MATIRYLDAQGSNLPLDLVGDSGMLPLSALMASLANPSFTDTDDESKPEKRENSADFGRRNEQRLFRRTSSLLGPYVRGMRLTNQHSE